jgi:hypothetical protein
MCAIKKKRQERSGRWQEGNKKWLGKNKKRQERSGRR